MFLKRYFLIFVVSIFLVLPVFAYATGPLSSGMSEDLIDQFDTYGVNVNDTFSDQGMTDIIAQIIKAFLSLLGIIFVVLMLIGGFNWMTANGDEAKIEKAKSTLQTAIIGLIIVVSTYSITYTVFKYL